MILDRYIAVHVLGGIAIVFALLVALFLIGDLIAELDDVGRGRFDYSTALVFVIIRTPGRMCEVLPAATLIGGLLGLGQLAHHGELTAMRAAGASLSRIVRAIMQGGAIMILAGIALGEGLAPPAERAAHELRLAALNEGAGATSTAAGYWSRSDRRFLHVDEVLLDGQLRGISMFEFDETGKLATAWRARRATPVEQAGNHWLLAEVAITHLRDETVETRQAASLSRELPAGAKQLDRLSARPDWLSLPAVVSYIHRLRENGLRTEPFETALWSRIMAPFATAAMLFTAAVLVLGPLRNAGLSVRIAVGIGFGIGFDILQKVFTQLGTVNGWPAPLGAAVPVGVLAVLGAWWLARGHIGGPGRLAALVRGGAGK